MSYLQIRSTKLLPLNISTIDLLTFHQSRFKHVCSLDCLHFRAVSSPGLCNKGSLGGVDRGCPILHHSGVVHGLYHYLVAVTSITVTILWAEQMTMNVLATIEKQLTVAPSSQLTSGSVFVLKVLGVLYRKSIYLVHTFVLLNFKRNQGSNRLTII